MSNYLSKEKESHAKNRFPNTNEALHGDFMSMSMGIGIGIWLHGCMRFGLYEILNHMHGCNGSRGHMSKLLSFPKQEGRLIDT